MWKEDDEYYVHPKFCKELKEKYKWPCVHILAAINKVLDESTWVWRIFGEGYLINIIFNVNV